MRFFKKSRKTSKQLNCFSSIDELPIKIWFDIHKTGDYRLLLKEKTGINNKDYEILFDVWHLMFNEWVERFGFSDSYLESLDLKIRIAKMQADYLITGQKYLRTLINIEKEKLRISENTINNPIQLNSVLWKLSKHFGFKLKAKELTVAEYYTAINEINNGG